VPWKRWQSRQELKPLRNLRIAHAARVAVTGRCLPAACFCCLAGHATQAKYDGSVMMPGTYNGARAPPVMSLFGGHCGAANRRHPRTASQNLRAVSQRSSSRRLLRYLIDRSDKGARSRHSRKFRPHIPPQLLNTGLIALAPSPKRRRSSTDETPHGAGALSFGSLRDSIPARVRVLKRELNSGSTA
jgi:hypothetical protein